MNTKVTLPALQQMKREGRKIVGLVVYDYQMAQIVDRVGADIILVGDSVGMNVWGHATEADVTLDQMVLVCQGVRRGVSHALVACDLPVSSLQHGSDAMLRAAVRLVEEGGADLVKIDARSSSTDGVRAVVRGGVPVWAQFGTEPAAPIVQPLVEEAKQLEAAGASLLDFRHSGPVAGPDVVRAVTIPVLGGLGGGPWLDGRIRLVATAIGSLASALDDTADRYANVAEVALTAIKALCDDVRAARPLRGAVPAVPRS